MSKEEKNNIWEVIEIDGMGAVEFECSNCKKHRDITREWKYCPNCGEKKSGTRWRKGEEISGLKI